MLHLSAGTRRGRPAGQNPRYARLSQNDLLALHPRHLPAGNAPAPAGGLFFVPQQLREPLVGQPLVRDDPHGNRHRHPALRRHQLRQPDGRTDRIPRQGDGHAPPAGRDERGSRAQTDPRIDSDVLHGIRRRLSAGRSGRTLRRKAVRREDRHLGGSDTGADRMVRTVPARAGLRFGHRTGDAGSPLQTCGRHARIVAAPHEAGIQQSADRHSERNHRRDARHLADRLCADTPPDRCAAGIRHERHSHASPQYIRRLRPDAPAARRTAQRTVGRSGRIQQCDTAYERFELDDAI